MCFWTLLVNAPYKSGACCCADAITVFQEKALTLSMDMGPFRHSAFLDNLNASAPHFSMKNFLTAFLPGGELMMRLRAPKYLPFMILSQILRWTPFWPCFWNIKQQFHTRITDTHIQKQIIMNWKLCYKKWKRRWLFKRICFCVYLYCVCGDGYGKPWG